MDGYDNTGSLHQALNDLHSAGEEVRNAFRVAVLMEWFGMAMWWRSR